MADVEATSCSSTLNTNLFKHLSVIPAVLIIGILSYLEKRRYRPELCGGRFAFVLPVRFLDGYKDRWTYAAAFGTSLSYVINMFVGTSGRGSLIQNVPLWAKAFALYLEAVEISLICFPVFACITTRYRLFGAICNALNLSTRLGVVLAAFGQQTCFVSKQYGQSLPSTYVMIAFRLLPEVGCYAFLIGQSLMLIFQCIKSKVYVREKNAEIAEPHQIQHVRLLFERKSLDVYKNDDKGVMFWRYKRFPHFRFPVQIVVLIFGLLVIFYEITLVLAWVLSNLSTNLPSLSSSSVMSTIVNILIVSGSVALTLSAIVSVGHLFLFMRTYRHHVLKLYRGDNLFFVVKKSTPQRQMAQSMRFSGYFIAYNLWGYIFLFLILWILGTIDGLCFHLIKDLGSFVSKILELLVFPTTTLVVFKVQQYLAKRWLLQDRIVLNDENPPLAVRNRKLYETLNYYFLFVNVAVGFVSSLIRTASMAVLNIFLIGRLDKNLFLTGWHDFDRGNVAYAGMLYLHSAHNHPVLRVFSSVLCEELKSKQDPSDVTVQSPPSQSDFTNIERAMGDPSNNSLFDRREHLKDPRKSTARKRWFLAYTLINNPTITADRRRHLPVTDTQTPFSDREFEVKQVCSNFWMAVGIKLASLFPALVIGVLLSVPAIYISSKLS